MKLTGKLRRTAIKMAKSFMVWRHAHMDKKPFIDNAYYITRGQYLVSLEPHFDWKNAYRAAKRLHSKAFIICGSTLNKRFPVVKSQLMFQIGDVI